MRIVFCDDDSVITQQLQSYVKDYFESIGGIQPEYAVYETGDLLIQQEDRVDIAFLDVEMPGVSGIHIGAKLKEKNPRVKIFIVTAYPDYLDEAMRFQVFRYLSKPIDKGRLFRNMKDALRVYNTSSLKIPVETKQGVFAISASELIFVEAQGRKVTVHTTKGDYESVHGMSIGQEN